MSLTIECTLNTNVWTNTSICHEILKKNIVFLKKSSFLLAKRFFRKLKNQNPLARDFLVVNLLKRRYQRGMESRP